MEILWLKKSELCKMLKRCIAIFKEHISVFFRDTESKNLESLEDESIALGFLLALQMEKVAKGTFLE